MKNLKTLVLMQLKDKVDFSYLKSAKKTIFKVVLSILKFAIITGLIWFGFVMISRLGLVSSYAGIPQDFFTVIFTIMYSLSVITCSFGLMNTLYVGRDNALLLTFPAKRTVVFTSKIIVYYVYELIRNVTYIVPLFVAYAIINHLPIYFYFWLVAIYFVVVAIPVVLGALLSIPAMAITNFIRQHKWVEYILWVGGTVGIVFAIIGIINAIPENIDLIGSWGTTFWQIRDFLNNFIKDFAPFYWVVVSILGFRFGVTIDMFTGKQWLMILGMFGIIVGVLLVTYLLVRPLYFRMASSPFEYKKKIIKREHKNHKNHSFLSSMWKDMLLTYRTQGKFYGMLVVVLGLPLAIMLLNKLYAAMDTRLAGTNMTIAFNVLMILLIVLSSNVNLSHIYSEEGASSYLLKTNPKPYLQTLFVKLMPSLILVTLSLITAVGFMCSALKINFMTSIVVFLMFECVYVSHMLMSAEMDIMNPQTTHYQTVGSHPNNPNDIKSTIYAFLMSALFAFLVFFLLRQRVNLLWLKLLLVAGGFLALRIWLFVNKIKVYFKERA